MSIYYQLIFLVVLFLLNTYILYQLMIKSQSRATFVVLGLLYFALAYIILFPTSDLFTWVCKKIRVKNIASHNDGVVITEIYLTCLAIALITIAIVVVKKFKLKH